MFHSALIFWNKKTNLFDAGSSLIPILMWVQKWQGGMVVKVCGRRRKTHSILFCSALSWLSRFLYTVSASVESSTSKGILGCHDDDDGGDDDDDDDDDDGGDDYDDDDDDDNDDDHGDCSPVFRGVTIKEVRLHPSGVLWVLNKPAGKNSTNLAKSSSSSLSSPSSPSPPS